MGLGPIAQALEERPFDEALLLAYFGKREWKSKVEPYLGWLSGRTRVRVSSAQVQLRDPTDFRGIYEAARRACIQVTGDKPRNTSLTFHLSSGSSQMAAVWLLLGKTLFPAELIESSREHGVQTAEVPFDIAADYLPDLLREQDERLRQQSAAESPSAPEFADIIHRSRVMSRLIQRARRVGTRNVPVLIEGESGTGKEMLARAIHRASPRKDRPFVAVNCGAIPVQLVESELFGIAKGVATDTAAREGYFKIAHGGTLFLDELGELPGPAQVKLLRTLQEGEIVKLGERTPEKVDVRVIAATNRTLIEEVTEGRFREDLFYRLAVAVLKIPPLRERADDVGLLVDRLLVQVNHEAAGEPGFKDKKLSAGARNLLLAHPWPGNVRELLNTLRRAAIWSEGTTISTDDAREALLPVPGAPRQEILGRPLGESLNLPEILEEVARHYLGRALDEAGGNKTKAARLVGLASYQTLTNWLKRHGLDV